MNLTDPSGRDPWWYEDPYADATVHPRTQDAYTKERNYRCGEYNYLETISGRIPGPCDDNVLFTNPHESLDAIGTLPVVGEPADAINTALYCIEGDFGNAALSAAAVVPFIGWGATATKWANRGAKYLRHVDLGAFRQLLRLGANDWTTIRSILDALDSDVVIRGMTDRYGNPIVLLVGSRDDGLKHLLGRHLTGDYPGSFTTFFSEQLKVGDIVDIAAQSVQNGSRQLDKSTGNWVYIWEHPTWGTIKTIVNSSGEVISAFPTK